MANAQEGGEYLVLWEFHVRAGSEGGFEQIYGSAGDWVRLFRSSPDYRGTQLSQDVDNRRRYVTLDRWSSRCAYDQFRQEHRTEYEAIDRRCGELTERELEIGHFQMVGLKPSP